MKNIFLLLLIITLGSACTRKQIDLEFLLLEMTDRENTARYPEPAFTLHQFSSYDRRAKEGATEHWDLFANNDFSWFIRVDSTRGRVEHVMLDAEGPGAIVRFWMTFARANAGKGTLRIYLDNMDEPAIEGVATDILSGEKLTSFPLSAGVSLLAEPDRRGHNLYLPLPYAKRCVITYENENISAPGVRGDDEYVYYNINCRKYDPDVNVVTWSEQEMKKAAKTLENVNLILRNPDPMPDKTRLTDYPVNFSIPAGQEKVLEINGTKAVRLFRLQVTAENPEKALRTTILEVSFDGNRTIWAPVGDFFGTGYQIRPYNSWYSGVDENGVMTTYWVMPFRENARFTFHNIGENEITLDGRIAAAPWKWDQRSMHFGSAWHQLTHIRTGGKDKGGPGHFDINYVELEGKGIYMGDGITLFNGGYGWWGEGDEKIYVDGESFPSHFGTGSEDYFGYAWCRPEIFIDHPFISQPDGSGNLRPGYSVNIRHRGLDGIPFTSSLKVDMEIWTLTVTKMNYAPVTYWYVKPGGSSNIVPDPEGAKAGLVMERRDIISPMILNGIMEGENMIFNEVTRGNFRNLYEGKRGWSNHSKAFWTGGRVGEELSLGFVSSEKSTNRIVTAQLSTAPEHGRYRIYINGNQAPGVIDCYSKEPGLKRVNLGKHMIQEGDNEIRVQVISLSPEIENVFFGLDYLKFE
jgi:hypothetical protein